MAIIYGPCQWPPRDDVKYAYTDDVGDEVANGEVTCAHCWKTGTFPMVFWLLPDGELWLHAYCVHPWTQKLLRDAAKAILERKE